MAARRAVLVFVTALVLALGAFLSPAGASAEDQPSPAPAASLSSATIVLFHGEGCPHCAAERDFLATLVSEHPEVTVEQHEVWNDPEGRDLLLRTADRLGFDPVGVPVTIVGTRVWIGFDEAIAEQIASAAVQSARPVGSQAPETTADERVVDVPVIGPVALDSVSLLAATVAIGFVDGVNPCSLWVLSLLLAMVLNRGSRGRVLLVGGTFLAVTSLMYGLYMVGLYGASHIVAAVSLTGMLWLRIIVAGIAGTFGVLQLKDGLGISSGPSLSIAPERRPALFARLRGVASPDRALAATLLGTAALAVAVSLLETPCTVGLPLLWTTLLVDQGVGPVEAVALFLVYLAVFLLDELVVFTAAVVTLRATRLQERHGRQLKLIAGTVLLALAITMLVAPAALTTIAGTIIVFAAALAAAAILYAVSSGRSAMTSRTTE